MAGSASAIRVRLVILPSEREGYLGIQPVGDGQHSLINPVVLNLESGITCHVVPQSEGRTAIASGEDVDRIVVRYVHILVANIGVIEAKLPRKLGVGER